ncbi:PREDICTED: uncharacterized protein PFB0765w-like [Amphimedon queenslandica]|uniref:Uncharacterized protein n=1 Tax=Amphimedon queenslandica TaxID=400682 RepID=A0AAN0JHQ8_AMPQE|nr:PREDICTED: uncharacterized protein PFB0765w-like [Amphimedon queenslandica]|eukprot:XP_019856509.1 PREDICTED: uncharacterized protein PFB0765w-like [Amphimedon queenslandica]
MSLNPSFFIIEKKESEVKFVTDTDKLIMIIELMYIEAGEWIVQSVLDANDLTSKKYQEKYSSYSKTRTWWMDQLVEDPTKKETELQRYIQLLHQKLAETNKQAKVDNNKLEEVLKAQVQLHKEKQIIIEDNEKLRATVAYNEVLITQIEEEKKQAEEEKKQVEEDKRKLVEERRQSEEQYFVEKRITKELKAKVAVNDVYLTELEEENEKVEKQYLKEKQITEELKSQMTKLEEEKEQVKKQFLTEKQITKELKIKVADNERYTAKLMRSQTKNTSSNVANEALEEKEKRKEQYFKKKQIITGKSIVII